MQMTDVINKMGRNDARIITRDSFLITLFFYGLVIIVILRLALPWLSDTLAAGERTFDLTTYYPLLVSAMILHQVAAVLGGTIMGFLLIDERDNDTLTALMVTPVPMRMYLLYKVLLPMGMGTVLSFVGILLLNNVTLNITVWQLIPISLVNGLFAAGIALMLATFSANKVEGFATVKIVGSLLLIIVGAWFLPSNWSFLMGFYPPFWTMKAYWSIEAGGNLWWLYLAISLVTHLGAIGLLIRRFSSTVYKG
jgi:fluoroquinolone transport system permease protein